MSLNKSLKTFIFGSFRILWSKWLILPISAKKSCFCHKMRKIPKKDQANVPETLRSSFCKRELKVIASDVRAGRVGEMNPPQSL